MSTRQALDGYFKFISRVAIIALIVFNIFQVYAIYDLANIQDESSAQLEKVSAAFYEKKIIAINEAKKVAEAKESAEEEAESEDKQEG